MVNPRSGALGLGATLALAVALTSCSYHIEHPPPAPTGVGSSTSPSLSPGPSGLAGVRVSGQPVCPAEPIFDWPAGTISLEAVPGPITEALVCRSVRVWTGSGWISKTLAATDPAASRLLAGLSVTDITAPSGAACPAIAVLVPGIYAKSTGSGWWRIHVPHDKCQFPQTQVITALDAIGVDVGQPLG